MDRTGGGEASSCGDQGRRPAESDARQVESRAASRHGEADETWDEIHGDRVPAAREDGESVDALPRWARAGVAEPYLPEATRRTFSEVYFRDHARARRRRTGGGG